jgi:hypothetical protein
MKKILITLSLVALVKLTSAQNYFYPAVNYTTSTYPFGVTTSDFNGDNRPDVALANRGSNNISVLLNTGTGTFNTGVTYSVGSVPVSVAAADFNNDGHKDMVACNNFGNNITILTNLGAGTFTASATYTVGNSPTSVATADFNGDNRPDIAVVNNGSSTISILLNTGTGTFATAVSYTAGSSPYRIAIADFNSDNKPDMAVSSYGNNKVAVLLNTGTGTFNPQATYAAGTNPYGISSGDFNGDGKADIVVADLATGGIISVLVNAGSGTFGAATSYTVGGQSYDVAAADFNGDGKTDIAVADYNDNSVAVLANTGTGTFSSQSNYTVEVNPTALSVADFNNDGKADIATANSNSNSASILNSLIPAAALNFDGVNDYVNVPNNAALNFGTNDFTVEADFQSSVSQPNYAGIVVKAPNNGGTNGGYQLVIVNNHIAAEISDGGSGFLGTANGLEGTTVLNDGNWHHLAMVVNRANNNIKLLVDGNVEANVTNSLIATINVSNPTVDMLLGVERTFALYAKGSMDEVRVWSRALCTSEIQHNLNAELPLTQNGLVAYYKFNQGFINSDNTAITTLTDATTNALSGTLNNMTLTGATSNFVAPGAVTTGSMVTAFSNTLSAVATQTDVVTCYGDANGTASVAVTGIESPFTYTWSAGSSTTNSATGLTNGNYTCTIANACGTIAQTFTIISPPPFFATSSANTILCYGGIATATVLASGGTQFSGGPSTPIYNGIGTYTVTAGVHTFTVTDAHNCIATTTLTTNTPTVVTPNMVAQNASCFGVADGSVTINPTGGMPPYMVNNPTTNLSAGDYTFTITDSYNCPTTTTITVGQPTLLTASATTGTIACNGGLTTVTVTATGGTAPYTNDGAFTNVAAGSYTYIVTDNHACTASTIVTVAQPNAITSTQSLTICAGSHITVGTHTYTTAGTFTDVLAAQNGCDSTVTTTIAVMPAPTASLNITSPACNDATPNYNVMGIIKVITASGTAPFNYYWYDSQSSSTNNTYYTGFATDSVKVTDAAGCSLTLHYTLIQPTPIHVTIGSIVDSVFCIGSCYSIPFKITGGTPPYKIYWIGPPTDVTNQQSITDSTTQYDFCQNDVNVLYDYQIWDSLGCGPPNYTSLMLNVKDCNVGIAQYSAASNLQVYPNPFTNELTIVSTAKTNALLFDMLGNKINEFVLQNTTQTISLESLAPGMYYLQVDNSKTKISKQ